MMHFMKIGFLTLHSDQGQISDIQNCESTGLAKNNKVISMFFPSMYFPALFTILKVWLFFENGGKAVTRDVFGQFFKN